MNQYGYALLGLAAIMAMLVGVLMIALLKLASSARRTRGSAGGDETTLLSSALQDAMTRLQAQERAMNARAVASEQLSGRIVESLTAGLLVVDDVGRVEILNPAGRKLLDVSEESPSADYRELLVKAVPLRDAVTECLATGNPIVRRTLEIPGTARPSHFGVSVSPLGANRSGVICLFADLTNVVELEEQLRLKEALARLGELTAGIAHEFRNGLATIHGYSRLLAPDTLPAAYRPYVEGIRNETEALGQVVTNFLNFARPTQLAVTPVDLGQIAARIAEELQHEASSAGGHIGVEGDWPVIEGDEVLLRQALSNLTRNAVEACVGAGIVPDVRLESTRDIAARQVRFQVVDNGPGIAPSVGDRIFRPFVTTKTHGTGLGLALVQKIVVTHNGKIQAGAGPGGRGTAMLVTLPLPEVLPKVPL